MNKRLFIVHENNDMQSTQEAVIQSAPGDEPLLLDAYEVGQEIADLETSDFEDGENDVWIEEYYKKWDKVKEKRERQKVKYNAD